MPELKNKWSFNWEVFFLPSMGILRAHPLLWFTNKRTAKEVYSLRFPRFWYRTQNLLNELTYTTDRQQLLGPGLASFAGRMVKRNSLATVIMDPSY